MAALFMVFLLVAFLVTDIIYRRVLAKKVTVAAPVTETIPIPFDLQLEKLTFPGGLFFHQGHTWAKLETSGNIKIGLDDFIQKIIGRIDGIKPRKVGDSIFQGDKIFTIEQGRRKAEFNSPVDGVIDSINEEIVSNPKGIKENPYEMSWIYSVKPTNLPSNIKSLSVAEDALAWLKKEVQKFREFIAEQFIEDKMLGKTLADGGVPIEGVMEHMDDFSWMKLQEEFLAK
jgi:glycine cleavage system H lipoate-binding protein